jgi:uncharacterized membrane protein YqjE
MNDLRDAPSPLAEIPAASRRLVKRAVDMGVNRAELLLVELQEERERLLETIIFALTAAVFGLLAGIAFTVCIVLLFWDSQPLIAAAALTVLYGAAALLLAMRLAQMRRDWHGFSATLDQLRKDSECLSHLIH